MGYDVKIADDINVLIAKVQAMLRRTYSFAESTNIIEHNGCILNLNDQTLRLNMIIEKEYFDSEEVRKANAMNDKTMAPPRRIRLATTDSNKYYAKAVFVADKENIITGELLYRPDFQESEEGVAFSEVVVKQTADVEEYFKNLIRFEGYKVISEEYDESDMLMHYDELSIQANKLLFLESREE